MWASSNDYQGFNRGKTARDREELEKEDGELILNYRRMSGSTLELLHGPALIVRMLSGVDMSESTHGCACLCERLFATGLILNVLCTESVTEVAYM